MIFCAHDKRLLGQSLRTWPLEPQLWHFHGLQAEHRPGPKASITVSPFSVQRICWPCSA
jgi:hypothetical protein